MLEEARRACTLQDLWPEDKQKVAKLLKQVVDLGSEVQRLKLESEQVVQAHTVKYEQVEECNKQLFKENVTLKKKLGQVLLVLRTYQQKVNQLEGEQQAQQARLDSAKAADTQTDARCTASVACGPDERAQAASASVPAAAPDTQQQQGSCSAAPQGAWAAAGAVSSEHSFDVKAPPCGGPPAAGSSAGLPPLQRASPGLCVSITISQSTDAATAAPSTTSRCQTPTKSGPGAEVFLLEPGDPAVAAMHPADLWEPAGALQHSPAQGAAGSNDAHPTSVGQLTNAPPAPKTLAALSIPTTTQALAQGYGGSLAYTSSAGANAGMGVLRSSVASLLGRVPGPRSIVVDSSPGGFDVPIHEVRPEAEDAETASPMIVPPSSAMAAAASSLFDWQVQQGLAGPTGASARGAAPAAAKVLRFDPAIGTSGAFYFVDVEESAGQTQEPAVQQLRRSAPPSVPLHAALLQRPPAVPREQPQQWQQRNSMDGASGAPQAQGGQGYRHAVPEHADLSGRPWTASTCTTAVDCSMPPDVGDTPGGLSRMADALDAIARANRWDCSGGYVQLLHGDQGRRAAGGSCASAAAAGMDTLSLRSSSSCCTHNGRGGGTQHRYNAGDDEDDDALMDILSQSDDLDQVLLGARARRSTGSNAAAARCDGPSGSATANASASNAKARDGAGGRHGGPRQPSAAKVLEHLLARDLYQENDVISAILGLETV